MIDTSLIYRVGIQERESEVRSSSRSWCENVAGLIPLIELLAYDLIKRFLVLVRVM